MDALVETEVQTFDSPFPSASSPSPGNNLEVGSHHEYQDTVPFDDTTVLESPSLAETEVLDNLECIDDIGEEVVPDSDDEGTDRTDVKSVMNGICSAETLRSTAGSTLGYLGCLRKQCNKVGAQTLGVSCSAISSLSDKGSDCNPNTVHTITQHQKPHAVNENGVSTVEEQMNNRFVNSVDQDRGSWEGNGKERTVAGEIKGSDLMTKVSSDSGKNVSLVTCDHEVATLSYIESQEPGDPSQANALDFVDHYLSVIDVNLPQEIENRKKTRIKSPPALSAKGPQSLARRANLRSTFEASRSFDWDEAQSDDGGNFILRKRKEPILDCKSHTLRSVERNLSEECKEKLRGAITNSTTIESRFTVHNSDEISETVQQQENDVTGADSTEIFDVGFDTQMAAEAMEELLYAPLPNNNATGLGSMLEDSTKGAMKKKVISSFDERPEPRLFSRRRHNRTKRRSNKLCSSSGTLTENQKASNLDSPITKKHARRKSWTENYSNCRIPADVKSSSNKRSSEVVAQREQQGTPKRKKVDTNTSTSKSVKHNLLPKEQITGTFSPIACSTRRNASAHSLKKVKSSGSNHDDMEVGVVKRRRNITTEKFHSSGRQATNREVNQNERSDPIVAASFRSNLDMWTFPKRKRTRPSHKKSEKVEAVNSISRSHAVESIKFDVLSDTKANTKTKVSTIQNKNPSKLPLLKELTRLGCTYRLPDCTSKDLRRRRTTANVRVLFSQSLDDDIMKQQRKILARLGISVALSCSDATHFITDRFVRTSNMLEAIAAGKPVVTHLWLESCAQATCLVDEKMYILRDAKKEKEIGFSMPVSLARARENPLLKGRRVFTTPNVKPGKEIIESLVKAVHGQVLENTKRDAVKGKRLPDDLLILSCEEDYSICEPFLEEGAAVYSSELLLNGIVTQKLDYKRHELFNDHVKRNRSSNSTWSKKSKVQPSLHK